MSVFGVDGTSLGINACCVFTLLCASVVDVKCSPGRSTFLGEKLAHTEQPHLGADYQRIKGPIKCCYQNEWLQYFPSKFGFQCVGLPPNIVDMAWNSSWFASFSNISDIDTPLFCRNSYLVDVWTKSSASEAYSEGKSVVHVATGMYFLVACYDYINIREHYSDRVDYEDAENFNKLESEVAGVVLCSDPDNIRDQITQFLAVYGVAASAILLAVTFYLHISTAELRRKVYDKCFLCQLATFIVAFVFRIWRALLTRQDKLASLCIFVAFMNQYWLLSAFSWLTILCIDLWSAISARKFNCSDKWKFIIYCAWAWGFPLLMVFVTFCATWSSEDSFFNLLFSEVGCWFHWNMEISVFKQPEFLYYYFYVFLCLLINMCLFIHIICIIICNDYRWRTHADSRKHETNKKRFSLYLKLFSTMGLTWLLEILCYFSGISVSWLSFILDWQQCIFQAILIFVVSICNSRVKEILKNRFFPNR